MTKQTVLQFGTPRTASVCTSCGQHFSGDARFCPFDGVALSPADDWDPSGDPLIGVVVDGRYEILEVLGEGGMGTVYAVRHVTLERRFALKVLRRDLASEGDLAARFIQEARAAARVTHPNVVQITDFGSLPSGQPYFVMELLEGQALGQLLRGVGAIGVDRVRRLTRQIAQALAAAHEAGVVHRDLKPDNIHVGENDAVKVLDFGLAKVAGASRFTRAGVVFGTPHYMSPEQAAGEPSDHRVDIYALGIVVYEMLTGKLPFEADSYMSVLTKHIYVVPALLSDAFGVEGSVGDLEQIVMRCLEKKPERRFESMNALIEALDSGWVAPPAAVAPTPLLAKGATGRKDGVIVHPPQSRRTTMALIGLAVAAALGVLLIAVTRRSPDPAATAPGPSAQVNPVAAIAAPSLPSPRSAPQAPTAPVDPEAPKVAVPKASGARTRPLAVPAEPAPKPDPSTHQKPRATPPKAPTIGGSDIINPWGE